jgi:hypothetical protein
VGTPGLLSFGNCVSASACVIEWSPVTEAANYQVLDRTGGLMTVLCTVSDFSCIVPPLLGSSA